ncbi:ABC transporter permease [Salinicola sp. DM10]|uniref:ABC transporter permease n=1 Tax=Salinicola sp. DM10 TaxID=2815721 RepID=UPI001A8FD3F8|nr:ABC transporter permease [Salinicola sp. DM10]MCE3026630.1 ABC transporter permease [Salinicola sp. DM10]
MQREGSPWTGLAAVAAKELADHLSSTRMVILEILVVIAAIGAAYTAGEQLKATVAESSFAFLALFTTAQAPLPSFVSFLTFFVPLIAIGLGFDAVNGEQNRGTLSRILSQPIYRDALLTGKLMAGMGTLAMVLVALWLLITGLGILFLGLPPSAEAVARGLWFLVATLFYGGVWLAAAMFFSIVFRQATTSAMASLGLWLLLVVLWPLASQFLAQALEPIRYGLPQEQLAQLNLAHALARLSPNTLYGETVTALLNPSVRTLGPVFMAQLEGAIPGSPLPLAQSLLVIWPQLVSLIAATVLLFALGYLVFQRREIRA